MVRKWNRSSYSGLAFYLILTVVLFLQLLPKTQSEYISPWDEMYHFSHLQYIYEGHLPKTGDVLNTWAKEGFSCKPVYPFGNTTSVPCGEIEAGYLYPEGGTNTADNWPPIYYLVAALLMRVMSIFSSEYLVLARIATASIWAIGLGALAQQIIKLGGNKKNTFAIAVTLTALPVSYFHAAFVTPHAIVPALVGFLMYVVRKLEFKSQLKSKDIALLVIFGAVLTLTVPHAIVLAFILSGWLLLKYLGNNSESKRPIDLIKVFTTSAIAPIASLISNYLWLWIQSKRVTSYSEEVNLDAISPSIDPGFGPANIADAVWRFFPHSIDQYPYIQIWPNLLGQITVLIAIFAVLSPLISLENLILRSLSVATLFFSIVFSIFVEWELNFPIPPRYGLSIGVLALAFVPLIKTSRLFQTLLLIFATITYATQFFDMPFVS